MARLGRNIAWNTLVEGKLLLMQQATLIDGRYSLLRVLGSGGMGCVYLARDESLRREVALKVLHEHYVKSDEFVERFRHEAKHAGALSHPNIVSVYDFGVAEDGSPYMAMEYVPGGTLKDEISRCGPLAPEEAAGVALQMAQALGCAHRNSIVHRDIKPENVLLEDGFDRGDHRRTEDEVREYRIKVTDFGIAKAAAEATVVTQNSVILGTVSYLSPEQAGGGEVGPASDLYSLGVVLFEMLTGRPPFEAEGAIAVAMKHVTEAPPSPRSMNPTVPESLAAITMRLLAKGPTFRHTCAEELADDLERVLDGRQLAPMPIGPLESVTEALPAIGEPPESQSGSRSGRRPDRVYRSGYRWRQQRVAWIQWAIASGAVVVVLLAAGLLAIGLSAGTSSSLGQEVGTMLGYDRVSGKGSTVASVILPASEGVPAAPKALSEGPGTPSKSTHDSQRQALSKPTDTSSDSVKTPAMATSSSSTSTSATASTTASASASSATPAAKGAPPNESGDDTAEGQDASSLTPSAHAPDNATSGSEQGSPQVNGPTPARPDYASPSNDSPPGAPATGGANPTPIQPAKVPPLHMPKIGKPRSIPPQSPH